MMQQHMQGEVAALLISPPLTREERVARGVTYLASTPVEAVTVTLDGFAGDRHAGPTRRADARVPFFPRGTVIRNTRQISLIAEEELAAIAAALGIAAVDPAWLGANLVTRGLPQLTALPPGTRLFFPAKATLVVTGENELCIQPGRTIAAYHPDMPKLAGRFVKAALGRRGLVAWVERAGTIRAGDTLQVMPPTPAHIPG
jgi:hypothetical protein